MVLDRRHPPALAASALALVLASCAPKPVLVGATLGLSGPASAIGVEGRNGIEQAISEINGRGGIRGRPVELIVENDGETVEGGRAAAAALIDRGAVVLLGGMTSAAATGAREVANERRVVLLSPTAASPDFSGIDDYFFRIIGSSDQQGVVLAGEALRRGYRRASVVLDSANLSYSKAVGSGFEAAFLSGGGTVVETRSIEKPLGFDFSALADSLRRDRPDLVLCAGSSFDLASIAQALASREFRIPLFGSMWARTPDIFGFGGRTLEGTVLTSGADANDPSPEVSRFREAYSARYGEPPGFAALYGYEAANVLAEAIRAVLDGGSRLDGPGIKAALLSLPSLPSLHGTLSFDRFGDTFRPYYLFEIRGEAFVRIP